MRLRLRKRIHGVVQPPTHLISLPETGRLSGSGSLSHRLFQGFLPPGWATTVTCLPPASAKRSTHQGKDAGDRAHRSGAEPQTESQERNRRRGSAGYLTTGNVRSFSYSSFSSCFRASALPAATPAEAVTLKAHRFLPSWRRASGLSCSAGQWPLGFSTYGPE